MDLSDRKCVCVCGLVTASETVGVCLTASLLETKREKVCARVRERESETYTILQSLKNLF